MKEIGVIIRLTDRALLLKSMGLFARDYGLMTCSMVSASRLMLTVLRTKENS